MSFKPSKKTLIKLSAAAPNSHDKAADPSLSIQPSSQDGRSRKSFFSFKSTTKRYLARPAAGHEPSKPSNSTVQFPLVPAISGSKQPSSTNSPPQLPLSTRTLRSSILFSQQFDFSHLGSSKESIVGDSSPISLQSESASRPLRSTTRPSSWMMLSDGTYAPSLKAQVQGPPQSDQCSPESFYNRSPTRVPQRVDNSDDDGFSHASAACWHRLPSAPPAQQPSHLKCILAGYQLQTPTEAHVSSQTLPHAVARSASKPVNVPSTSNVLSAPTGSSRSSDYSPLAAFLGQSKPTSFAVPTNRSTSSNTLPSSFLSAFLGNQPSEHPQKTPSSQLSTQCTSQSQLVEALARPEAPLCLEKPSPVCEHISVKRMGEVEECVTQLTSDPSPISDLLLSSRALDQLASCMDAIDATEIDQSSERKQSTPEFVPSLAFPSCSTLTIVTPTSSPRSAICYTPSRPHASALEKGEKSISLDSSTSDSGPCDSLNNIGSFQKCESRKQNARKVYVDSSSQYSSICSDNSDSVDDAMRKRTIDSDLSQAFTDPSSTCSHSSSASVKTLESLKEHAEPSEIKLEDKQEVNHVQRCDSSSDREPGSRNDSITLEKSATDAVSDNTLEEVEAEDDTTRRCTINFEHLLLRHPEILRKVVSNLDYLDFFSLSQITDDFLEELESDPRLTEIILKRYLAGFGYRSSTTRFISGQKPRELPIITLNDLASFYAGLEFEAQELIEFSKQALKHRGLDYRTAKMIRSSVRAHNKLVAYMRAVEELGSSPGNRHLPHRHAGRSYEPIYKPGKAPVFKVWVPSADHWMSNEELAECERELWRSQIWSYLKKGDVCWNLAIGDFANEGKLLFDGKFLRDLLFDFDEVGHLPSWLDMLAFPPSYYHRIISSSTSTPIFYLDLSNYKDEIKNNLKLSEDKVEVASPQARYRVQRWVYRSIITIPTGEWTGYVVIEVEGTSEQAKDLLKRCNSSHGGVKNSTPWRIIREKSRPGKLWIRPVNDDERIN